MDKLALGMALVSLIYIALFLAVGYFNGLLEEWKWSRKSLVPRAKPFLIKLQNTTTQLVLFLRLLLYPNVVGVFLKISKKRQPEDRSHDVLA